MDFSGNAYEVLRVIDIQTIQNDLYYVVEASGRQAQSNTEKIYYKVSDGRLYIYNDNKLVIFQ